MKNLIFFVLSLMALGFSHAQTKTKSPKIVLVTIDGLRWQELFTGADPALVANKKYARDTTATRAAFWRETPQERRAIAMPFLWQKAAKMGQIHGNRTLENYFNVTNKMSFSYPGYNEILTGQADDARIKSNEKINNPNKTFLEIMNETAAYKGKVAAFTSWDVLPYVINAERSGIYVNGDRTLPKSKKVTEREAQLNKMENNLPVIWREVRFDLFSQQYALAYMKEVHPETVYVAFGETDDFAHEGNYSSYLASIQICDRLIEELWNFTQQDEFYKDNTIFFVTTDHGRGADPIAQWTDHGAKIAGADQTWLAVFGNGINQLGEVSEKTQLCANQIAPTILQLLNVKSTIAAKPIAKIKK